MIAQSRLLGTRGAAAKKKQQRKQQKAGVSSTALQHFPYIHVDPSVITGEQQLLRRDPYAVPRRRESEESAVGAGGVLSSAIGVGASSGSVGVSGVSGAVGGGGAGGAGGGGRVVLSRDPLIRVMMDERVKKQEEREASKRRALRHSAAARMHRQSSKKLAKWRKRFTSSLTSSGRKFGGVLSRYYSNRSKGSSGDEESPPSPPSPPRSPNSGCSPFRAHGGRVTAACLWHACRVVTIGILLMCIGIVMSILGKICRIFQYTVPLLQKFACVDWQFHSFKSRLP